MKTRLGEVLTGIVVLGLLAVTVAACGDGTKATPGTAVVSTLAGQTVFPGNADGSGAAARLDLASGIACDAAGNLFVVDGESNTIRKITLAGKVTTLAGKAGAKGNADGRGPAARFNDPGGIACDAAGNLYVADNGNGTIRKITPAGEVTTLAGMAGSHGYADGSGAAARFFALNGIACDAAGNVYVFDLTTIRKITPAGKATTLAGKFFSDGSVDGAGAAARFDGGTTGITCDAAGNLYVTDNNTIRKITPAGEVTTLAGREGSFGSADGNGTAARFYYPEGIACDAAGNLYVADTNNSTIRKITPTGEVTTLAGKAGSAGNADGSGTAARFYFPCGIARDAAGELFVADVGNNTIRKVTVTY